MLLIESMCAMYMTDPLMKGNAAKSRYRTPTIYNVFFDKNQMAEGGIRNDATGDSVDVSCFYSHIRPSWIPFGSVIVQTL